MQRKMRGVGTGFKEMRLRGGVDRGVGGGGGCWRRGHEGERSKISVRLRGSKGRGALEVNYWELSRYGMRVLLLILLFGLLLLVSRGRIFWFYFLLINNGYYYPLPSSAGKGYSIKVRLELCPIYLKVYTNPLRLFSITV